MTAGSLAQALGGRRIGSGWMTRCPAHQDRTPSLSISSGLKGVVVYCHSGCNQARVITALRSLGLWKDSNRHYPGRVFRRKPPLATDSLSDRNHAIRSERALQIWKATVPAPETLVEKYLRSRGLGLPPSSTLRFHAGLKHPSGGIWPAMVALVTRGSDNAPLSIHRTFLARDGLGKAQTGPQKMMFGPCRGGAVRLGTPADLLMVGEGIETCLAVMQAMGQPTWAALSTSGLRTLDLPDQVRHVIVLADGDGPGEAAARDCARRWQREGRCARLARPPRGWDFNDLLLGRVCQIKDGPI